jgi:hypothetical protein
MPVLFRKIKITKPKLKGVRQDAYLNGKKLWIPPDAKTVKIPPFQKIEKDVELFHPALSVVASSNEPGRGNAQNIIDGNFNTLWQSQGSAPQWIYVILDKPAIAKSYTLTCYGNEPVNLPTAWQIQGSNNTSNWTTLHSVSGWDPSDKWEQTWDIPQNAQSEYRYYRFYCTSVRTPSNWVYLSEWRLTGDVTAE